MRWSISPFRLKPYSAAVNVLLDAMYDGLESQLEKQGYKTYSVNKLRKEEEKLGHDFNVIMYANHDFNVIMYAKDHEMVLITNDNEIGKACRANGFPCIFVNLESILEKNHTIRVEETFSS